MSIPISLPDFRCFRVSLFSSLFISINWHLGTSQTLLVYPDSYEDHILNIPILYNMTSLNQ